MYKIMLADDEGIVIDSLKFLINKEFEGECEIEYARTGRKVIELAETFRPDIAIMDIQMPGINGIEAMEEIRRNNNKIIFIVMSAYDKFDYAKEAMKLGAIEYLTKPMEKTKMISALRHAMKLVSEEKERRSNDLLVREKLEIVVPILENGLIYNIIFHEHIENDIENYITMLDIKATYAYMMVTVAGDTKEGGYMTNAVGSSVKLQQHAAAIREYIKSSFESVVGNVMGNKIAIMVPYEDAKQDLTIREEILEKARGLVDRLNEQTGIAFRIGIGKVNEITKMEISYREAVNALMLSKNTVAHADDLPIGCEYESDYPIELETSLFDEIEKGRTEAALSAAQKYFEWIKNQDMMNARMKILEFALWAERIAYASGGMTYSFGDRHDYLPTIMGIDSMEELWKWFSSKIVFSSDAISNKNSDSSNDVILSAKKYIEDNFAKNITLDDVSYNVNISPYYLSRLFKEATGQNFIDYLTELRIDKAKELLSQTQYSMKEICSMCGYSDPNYLSKSFKKRVGVTPTEYREGK